MRTPSPRTDDAATGVARAATFLRRAASWRSLIAATALCALALGLTSGLQGTELGSYVDARAHAQTSLRSPCTVTPDKYADPTVLDDLGDRTTVTLTLTDTCPEERAPVDIVLVFDKSNSMNEIARSNNKTKLANAKLAAIEFVDNMNFNLSKVALVAFNHQVGLRVPLTDDGERVKDRVRSMQGDGETNVTDAIRLATSHMLSTSEEGRSRAMIVLTDGIHNATQESPLVAAREAKAGGLTVITICAASREQCDPSLQDAASAPDLFFLVEDSAALVDLYRALANELQQNAIVALTVRDVVPANMTYIAGSAVPATSEVLADTPDPGQTTLVWQLTGSVPDTGLTYVLEPQERGTHPTNVVATGDFVDRKGLPGDTVFPIPEVFIPGPSCPPQHLEVYYLIDDSTCLFGSTLNGMLALEAIAQGIEKNLDEMDLANGDQVAVIGFGDSARVYQELTNSKEAIRAAVRRVAMLDRSARLDLAFNEVRREIARADSNHDPSRQLVTVTVTDGPMMAAPDRAVHRAIQLRTQVEALHYTIGVGPIVQHQLLRQVAEPGGYRAMPLGGDVIAAYVDLGTVWLPYGILCPQPTPNVPEPTATETPPTVVEPKPNQILLPLILRTRALR